MSSPEPEGALLVPMQKWMSRENMAVIGKKMWFLERTASSPSWMYLYMAEEDDLKYREMRYLADLLFAI